MTMLPPLTFDHAYAGLVVEQMLSAMQVERACGLYVDSCMLVAPNFLGDKCFIVLPKIGPGGVSARDQALLRRHEIGHCNGWGPDHAGGR